MARRRIERAELGHQRGHRRRRGVVVVVDAHRVGGQVVEVRRDAGRARVVGTDELGRHRLHEDHDHVRPRHVASGVRKGQRASIDDRAGKRQTLVWIDVHAEAGQLAPDRLVEMAHGLGARRNGEAAALACSQQPRPIGRPLRSRGGVLDVGPGDKGGQERDEREQRGGAADQPVGREHDLPDRREAAARQPDTSGDGDQRQGELHRRHEPEHQPEPGAVRVAGHHQVDVQAGLVVDDPIDGTQEQVGDNRRPQDAWSRRERRRRRQNGTSASVVATRTTPIVWSSSKPTPLCAVRSAAHS